MGKAGVALGLVSVVGHGVGISHILLFSVKEHLFAGILSGLGEGHPLVQALKGGSVQLVDGLPQGFDGPAEAVADAGKGAGENQGADALRVVRRQDLGDGSAHGYAVYMGFFDSKGIHDS